MPKLTDELCQETSVRHSISTGCTLLNQQLMNGRSGPKNVSDASRSLNEQTDIPDEEWKSNNTTETLGLLDQTAAGFDGSSPCRTSLCHVGLRAVLDPERRQSELAGQHESVVFREKLPTQTGVILQLLSEFPPSLGEFPSRELSSAKRINTNNEWKQL
ncbi:unnamed protein product [Pleuronectes platessa]|uniref:Uncharacterized protein n=1 Tax=Pleuronectes platessa TaxID=8262 RepID=A0A9N7YST7_PLEPL|nr:unnamed protein product [Pleuronectes platessa]